MFRVKWDEALVTGVAEIDEQHREIFARFNYLLQACDGGRSREVLTEIIGFMNDYLLQHFRDEEALQARIDYPHLADHKTAHEALFARFAVLNVKFAANGSTVQLVIETCKLLAEILFEHILLHDKALAGFLLSRQVSTAGKTCTAG